MSTTTTKQVISATALVALSACVGAALARGPSSAAATPAAGVPTDGSIADVAERSVESVVNISTSHKVAAGPASTDPWFTDPRSPFYQGEPDERMAQSLGSGVIVSGDGRVLTNAHVVAGGDDIKVSLSSGVELDAKLVGIDESSDLAVLQLEGKLPTLRAMPVGDSSRLRLGDVVLAIGNPFGVGQAVTMGIVSAQGRASVGIEDYEDFIQTDAAINPGNSGGALVNLNGELIGVNTAILSRSGGYQGIGFAIPTQMAVPIMDALIKDGKVSRGFLGIGIATVTKALAAHEKLGVDQGVLVTGDIAATSPAGKAGLQAGDVITAIDGVAVRDAGKLRNAIALKGAGGQVTLAVMRGTAAQTVKATLGELPAKVQRHAP